MAVLLVLLDVSALHAANWYMKSDLNVSLEHNSNPLLRVEGYEGASGSVVDARFTGGVESQRAGVSLMPRYISAHYDNNEERLDRDDKYLDLRSYRLGQRYRVGLDLTYADKAIQSTDIDSLGLVGTPLESLNGAVSFSWSVTQQDTFSFAYQDQSSRYEEPEGVDRLVDYDYSTASVSWQRTLGEQVTVGTTVYRSEYDALERFIRQETYAADLFLEYQFTERFSMNLNYGEQRIDTFFRRTFYVDPDPDPGQEDDVPEGESGWIGQRILVEDQGDGTLVEVEEQIDDDESRLIGLNLRYKYEITDLDLTISQDIYPSNIGSLTQRNELSVGYSRKLGNRTRFSLRALYADDEDVFSYGSTFTQSREYKQLSMNISWQLTQNWSVSGQYGTVIRTYVNEPVDGNPSTSFEADNDIFRLNLVFNGKRQ